MLSLFLFMHSAAAEHSSDLEALRNKVINGDTSALTTLQSYADKDDHFAQYFLGDLYANGIRKEENKADEWYAKAQKGFQIEADKGNPEAQYFISRIYFRNGNREDAERLMRQSAESGNARAAYDYAVIFTEAPKRTKWFRIAAEHGNLRAMNELASDYDIKKDYSRAKEWYEKTAMAGDGRGQRALSHMYAKGEGVKQDWKESYFWGCLYRKCFNQPIDAWKAEMSIPPIAVCGGYIRGINFKLHDALVHLTAEEIEEIRKRAADWKPTPFEK